MSRTYTQLATLVPVLNRPQNVQPLVASWRASRTPGILVFIVEIDDLDELLAVHQQVGHGVEVITVVDAHTWPEKINVGIEQITADWYLCAADDVHFTRGWWQHTLLARQNQRIGVIGTNDLANPRVIAGDHTCHPLIRRQYVLDHGTWDQPGRAIHEGYRHWYCDDELVITAKIRDAWQFCPEAIIEHHHPYWTGKPADDTYRLGESNATQDRETFLTRMNLMGVTVL